MEAGRGAVPAGVLSGLSGLVVFLVLHHLWIAPIWFVAPAGIVLATAGGAATGAAYAELLPHLPRRPWRNLAVLLGVSAILTPAVVVAEVRGPIFAMNSSGGGDLLVSPEQAVMDVVGGLFGTAALAGAALGWSVGRSRRAAWLTSLAAVAIAAGPGHNVPLLGGTSVVRKELVILTVVFAVSSVVLVEGQALAGRRRTLIGTGPS